MPVLQILLIIILVGVLLWFTNAYVPMDSKIKTILNIVVVLILVVWLLRVFGVWSAFRDASV